MAIRTSANASSGVLPNAAQDFKSGTSATQALSFSDQKTMMRSGSWLFVFRWSIAAMMMARIRRNGPSPIRRTAATQRPPLTAFSIVFGDSGHRSGRLYRPSGLAQMDQRRPGTRRELRAGRRLRSCHRPEQSLELHLEGVYYCMTEKRKPTYDFDAFKAAVQRVTVAATRTAAALGFGRAEIEATIQTMQRKQFYKSMTAYYDHRVWQDVYHVPSPVGTLYIKFTADVVTEFVLLSLKEKRND
jgi:motility quorum-sensing regulator/GCU-specific mRNA interferase toxin